MDSEGKLIRVDMTEQSVEIGEFPAEWKLLGGRALTVEILMNECDPQCDPL
jgi:aldehyde:ferredoxin oxidoreductase